MQCNSLRGSVYSITQLDLKEICENLSSHTKSGLTDLVELLSQKREWRMSRYKEMHMKYAKSTKILAVSTSFQSILAKQQLQQVESPNTMKLRAASDHFSIQSKGFTSAADFYDR